MDLRLPEVEELSAVVRELAVRLQRMEEKVVGRKLWYGREDLAELKSMKVSAFYNKPWLLPPAPPSKQGGNERWSHAQVWDSGWIWKSDADLRPAPTRQSHDNRDSA